MFRQFAISTAALVALVFGLSSIGETQLSAVAGEPQSAPDPAPPVSGSPALDRSGERRVGKASFYAERYVGRKMADGTRMRREGDNAASLTLPLGTVAQVTNLETGRSEVVTIRDRGPYVNGRIIDLSPGTAKRLGISRRQGLARVAVAPISVPLAGGDIKPGAAADERRDIRVSAAASAKGHTFAE